MSVWETPDVIPAPTPAMLDFARIWQAADKIVYSKSLETASTRKTRLEREFDPEVVRGMKSQLHHDVSVGGPTLAAHAIRAGLVDEYLSSLSRYQEMTVTRLKRMPRLRT